MVQRSSSQFITRLDCAVFRKFQPNSASVAQPNLSRFHSQHLRLT